MQYIKMKGTELTVSNVALGTDVYGSVLSEEEAFLMLDFYKEHGGNLIDTAECYARWISGGEFASENTLGKWLKSRGEREKIVISTKGGHYSVGERPRLTRDDILTDIEGSLKRLGTDYIDIYWLHRDDISTDAEEIADVLAEIVQSGKARYIGVSNWTCDRLDKANAYLKSKNKPMLCASQIQYSPALANKEKNEPDLVLINDKEYEYFKNHELTVFAFAAQAKGFFSKYAEGGKERTYGKAYDRYFNDETLKRFENIKLISEKMNVSIGSVVIAALTNNYDFDTVPIVGCKNTVQLSDTLSGADLKLEKADVDFIFNR